MQIVELWGTERDLLLLLLWSNTAFFRPAFSAAETGQLCSSVCFHNAALNIVLIESSQVKLRVYLVLCIDYCLYILGLWKTVPCKTKILDIMKSREMFILPLYLPCDECSSIATFKGTVNLLYWIIQIDCIANLGKFEVTILLYFPHSLLVDVSLLLSFLIFCNFRCNPNTSTRVTVWFPCYPTRKYTLPCLSNTLVLRSLCGLLSLAFPSLPVKFWRNFKSTHEEFILVFTAGNSLKSLFCVGKLCSVG